MNGMIIRYAWHELRHGWRHFVTVMVCITLGVGVMALVNGVAAMVQRAMGQQAQSLLGGDVEISLRGIAASDEAVTFLREYGDLSYVATLRAMLQSSDDESIPTLVELKAVDSAYPLLGDVALNETISVEEALANDGANNGIIVDPSLLSQASLALGDRVTIGQGEYVIRATVAREPDRIVQIFSFGPRIFMNHQGLDQTALVQTFSLVEHRYRLVLDDQKNIVELVDQESTIKTALQERFPDQSWRVKSGTDGNRGVKRFMDYLMTFLTLSALATLLISGIGIASSIRHYLQKKSQTIAMLKMMGASRWVVLGIYTTVLTLLAVGCGVIGSLCSVAIIAGLKPLLLPFMPILEDSAVWHLPSLLLAVWYGLLITFIFCIPALLAALDVKPALLFRTQMVALPVRMNQRALSWVIGLITMLIITAIFTTGDPHFIVAAIGVIILTFIVFTLFTRVIQWMTKQLNPKASWLRMALRNMHREGSSTQTVMLAIGVSLTVLITLVLTEANLQARIAHIVQERAPSLFMIDIQPYQKDALYDELAGIADDTVMMYPMVRGRITAINGKAASQEDVSDDIKWALRGDRALSYSARLPDNANISQGKWWNQDYNGPPLVSVDERFLDGMNIAIGDSLTLRILGQDHVVEIASARAIDYSSFQMNFALILSPGVIDHFPQTYFATVFLTDDEDAENALVRSVAQQFPNVTIIRTKQALSLVHDVLGHIAMALKAIVAITLIAGLLVLGSALSAMLTQRMYDMAIFKILGARRRDIIKSCMAEWMILSVFTALIAVVMGTLSAWLLLLRFESRQFYIMPQVTGVTILLCITVIMVTGYIGNRQLFRFRVGGLLRNE